MKPYPALLAELLSEELSSLRQQKPFRREVMRGMTRGGFGAVCPIPEK